jgi:hypothetical protein
MPKWRDWTELIFAPLTVAGTTADVISKARVGLTGGKEKRAQDVAGGFRLSFAWHADRATRVNAE